MSLTLKTIVQRPNCMNSHFDLAPTTKSRVVFSSRIPPGNKVEVIDHDTCRHVGTLSDFPEAAGVVAEEG